MSNFNSFQYLKREQSATPTPSFARPVRPFAAVSSPSSQSARVDLQGSLERAERFGHSFERIPLFPPEREHAPKSSNQAQDLPALQRTAGNQAVPNMIRSGSVGLQTWSRTNRYSPQAQAATNPQAIQAELGPGSSLGGSTKAQMESAFGQDFSHVRIHTDAHAAAQSKVLNARAFTIGRDIAFGSGEYQPGTLIGDTLIAHELAHVVQQSGANTAVAPMQIGDTSYNTLEEDADMSAMGVVASLWGGLKNGAQNAMPHLRSGLRLQGKEASFGRVIFDGSTDRLPPEQSVSVPVKVSGGPPEQVINIGVEGSGKNNGIARITEGPKLTDTGSVQVQGGTQTPEGNAGKLKLRASVKDLDEQGFQTKETKVGESPGFTVAAWPKDFTTALFSDYDTPSNLGLVVLDRCSSDAGSSLVNLLDKVEISEQVGIGKLDNPPFNKKGGTSDTSGTSGYQPVDTYKDEHIYGRPFINTSGLTPGSYTSVYTQLHIFKCKRTGVTDQVIPNSGFTITHRVWWDEGSAKWKHQTTKEGASTIVGNYQATAGSGKAESKVHDVMLVVRLGTEVDVESGSGKRTFKIVEVNKADPSKGLISDQSPIGKALMGHKENDSVSVSTPGGVTNYTIHSIRGLIL